MVLLLAKLPLLAFATSETYCYQQTMLLLRLEKAKALELCAGAYSDAPLQCYRQAQLFNPNSISEKNTIRLCQFAASIKPAYCFRDALLIQQLSEDEGVELCRTRTFTLN
jgi:hypothetical protein